MKAGGYQVGGHRFIFDRKIDLQTLLTELENQYLAIWAKVNLFLLFNQNFFQLTKKADRKKIQFMVLKFNRRLHRRK